MEGKTYEASGVSLALADSIVGRLRAAVESTGTSGFGAFAGGGDRDVIDVAILCAGGQAAIASAFSSVRPGGRVVALGLSGKPTIPFDFDGLVVRDVDLIGVLGSVGFWPDAIELITSGRVQTEPLVTGAFGIERTRDALEHLVKPGTLKVLIEPA